jgi:hypothetical protein
VSCAQKPATCFCHEKINLVHARHISLFKIQFNIILSSMSRSSKCFLSFYQIPVFTSPHTRYMFSPSSPSRLINLMTCGEQSHHAVSSSLSYPNIVLRSCSYTPSSAYLPSLKLSSVLSSPWRTRVNYLTNCLLTR